VARVLTMQTVVALVLREVYVIVWNRLVFVKILSFCPLALAVTPFESLVYESEKTSVLNRARSQ